MKLVVGLGNPGVRYEGTRHNAGFWVIDELAARHGVACTKSKFRALVGELRIGQEKVLLCKPQTFMNLSGESVREVLAYYPDIDPQADLVVVFDDMDFPVGEVRLRAKGSAGGHNGVKSVIAHVGHQDFPRVRVGIGRPREGEAVIDHVLSTFSKADRSLMEAAVIKSADAIAFAVEHSFTLAMNRFNGP